MTQPPLPSLNTRARLSALLKELNLLFFERDEELRGMLAAMLAGEHVLLLGPVGTAKSMMAVELCRRITGALSWAARRCSCSRNATKTPWRNWTT